MPPAGDPATARRLHLGGLNVLLLEADGFEAEILLQVLAGLGIRRVARCVGEAEAWSQLAGSPPDLLVVGQAASGGADQYAFIRRLRRGTAQVATAPAILLAGHTSAANVLRARDCGASLIVAKPVCSTVLFDRLAWLAADARGFVATDGYAGPDRRFQSIGPPAGASGQRRDDTAPDTWEREADRFARLPPDKPLTVGLPGQPNRLSKLVNRSGGVSAPEAEAAAAANLVAMRGGAIQRIGETLDRMQALAAAGAQGRAELYRLSNSLVGSAGAFGLGELGAAAFSLCALLDRRAPGDHTLAVKLHLDSMRLLRAGSLDPGAARAIGTALSRVVNRLAAAEA